MAGRMPIYEYRCLQCGKKFEMLQSITSAPLKKCIACQGVVEKLISVSSFQLKGNGWYATDYGSKPAPQKDLDASPVADSKTEKKTKKIKKTCSA